MKYSTSAKLKNTIEGSWNACVLGGQVCGFEQMVETISVPSNVLGLTEEVDMEKALLNAKRTLAMQQGRQLTTQWQIEKTTGILRSSIDEVYCDKEFRGIWI